jgi:hypothetical protein
MRLLVVAGLMPSLSKRLRVELKNGLPLRQGWEIETLDSKDQRRHSITAEQAVEAMRVASKSENAHILGVSNEAGPGRQTVGSSIRQYFRFRWLDNRLLPTLTPDAQAFVEHLNNVLAEEEFWAEHIKPDGPYEALILPKACFRVRAPHVNLWGECEAYGNQQIAAAFAQHLDAFRNAYSKRSMGENNKFVHWWTDEDDLAYQHRGAPHGLAPFPRCWKYSLKLMDGFHYDINHARSLPFRVTDANGGVHRRESGKHVNLDPHGYVRTMERAS